MKFGSRIGIIYLWPETLARKQGKVSNVFNWDAQGDILALARDEAVVAGENARVQLELEEADEELARETVRRRLARTLVQLGMKIDPSVGEEPTDAA